MGIRGMTRLLTCIQETHPYVKYRTKIVAVDVNILIYKFCHMYYNSIALFLECFVSKICSFLRFGIYPVFIFDGDAPIEKRGIIRKRFNTKRKNQSKLEELQKSSIDKNSVTLQIYMKRLQRKSFMVTKYHRAALVRLLDSLDLPYIIADGEAEVMCALLQKSGHVHYTLSDDTDTIAYGCTQTIRMFSNCERYLIETDINKFLTSKCLTSDEFLTACVLSGCDYLNKPSVIHIEKCIDYVKKFHTLEATLKELQKDYAMYSIEEYQHIKDIYMFKTKCIQRIVDQHKKYGSTTETKLSEYKEFTPSGIHKFIIHLQSNGVPFKTIQYLTKNIKESISDFLLIRHNFFSSYYRNKNVSGLEKNS